MYYVGLSLPNFISDSLANDIKHATEKANLSVVDIGFNAMAVAGYHGLHLGRIIADGFESARRLVMVMEYGEIALVVSLLTLSAPYGSYIDGSIISKEFGTGLGIVSPKDWKSLTHWINDFVIKHEPRRITNVVLTGARSTEASFQQAVKNSYVGGLIENPSMVADRVDSTLMQL